MTQPPNSTCNHPGCTETGDSDGYCHAHFVEFVVPQFFVEADEHRGWLAEELRKLEAYHG